MDDRIPGEAAVRPGDADFRVGVATMDQLIEIQQESERMGWANRWSSSRAMLEEVGDKRIYICPLIRERRDAEAGTTKYRCFVLYRRRTAPGLGRLVTFDIASESLIALPSLELAADGELAFAELFVLAADGIEMAIKD